MWYGLLGNRDEPVPSYLGAANTSGNKKGQAAIEKARSVGARTDRERDYIAAMEVFYKDAGELDLQRRLLAYSEAMERLYLRYPKDREAAVFYALTLIAAGMMANDKSYTSEKKAAEILNRVLAAEPEHPGMAHYLIHSYDFPSLAAALPAARSYAKIAPASAHALHMPSHIFTRLGLWQESFSRISTQCHQRRRMRTEIISPGPGMSNFMRWTILPMRICKVGRMNRRVAWLDELNRIQKAEPENFKGLMLSRPSPRALRLNGGNGLRRWS